MKKIVAALLALTLTVGLAACGNQTTTPDTTTEENLPASALEILETVWNSYGEEDKFFTMGGDMENPVDNAPGAFGLTDVEALTATLLVPAENAAQIQEAASLVHAMNLNNFTCGAYRMAQGADAAAFAETMYKVIAENRWLCGTPEQMLIVTIGEAYVVVMFGLKDVISTFQSKLTAAYPMANIRYNEAITG